MAVNSTNFSNPVSPNSTNYGAKNTATIFLLLQIGDKILLQNGDKILLDSDELKSTNYTASSINSTNYSNIFP